GSFPASRCPAWSITTFMKRWWSPALISWRRFFRSAAAGPNSPPSPSRSRCSCAPETAASWKPFSAPGRPRANGPFASAAVPPRGGPWALHCQGTVRERQSAGPEGESFDVQSWTASRASQDGCELYTDLRSLGLQLGPSFRLIRTVWRADQEALAELVVPDGP